MRSHAPPARQVRIRKLAKNAPQIVLREDQIEPAEYSSLQNQYTVETGVEKSEEKARDFSLELREYHLQAALAATSGGSDKDAEKEIPAPPAQESSNFDYDSLYMLYFEKPTAYIRFSQTVEDCTGCQYNMTTKDDEFLKVYNENRSDKCSEDDFEKIMEIFVEVSEVQTPNVPVDGLLVTFDEMSSSLRQQLDERTLVFSKDIYEHWKSRVQQSGSNPLQPTLKFEKNQEKDDGDPYVCFRRRDARQTRKTRARDLQSTDKLKKLRKELEDGRNLLDMAYHRELLKRDLLLAERGIFEKRMKLKEVKIKLSIPGNDHDLVNEKPIRRRENNFQRNMGSTQSRGVSRSDGRSLEADLIQLSDEQEKREKRLRAEIEEKIRLHRKWNEGHIDLTQEPLSPVHEQENDPGFRTVTAQYQLVTPPSSVTFESFDSPSSPQELSDKSEKSFCRFSPPPEDENREPSYRRRIGRGGRLWIDRRGIRPPVKIIDPTLVDRWRYDREDEDEQPIYDMDPHFTTSLKFRATIPFPAYLSSQYSRAEGKNVQFSKKTGFCPENPSPVAVLKSSGEKPPD
ncbi:Enhancer of polycomb-like protein 1 [Golovinomyces cichoracearum]|uniref:Enhancer of polycomb-like protein n=1 Tax=Golovinomyces cichoracearum TaxID=62708 RepID=A0A420IL96_9PEZI|nr:Enhancer of polycomb-like protein 1 [Golovinomyces cichoracearum]